MIRWLALLLLLPAATAAQTAPAPAPSTEGRADAPVLVVTYLSFTCSHCADREAAVSAPLHRLIAEGTVREETRHAVRDGLDLIAATLARCQGPAAYPGNRDALFATQGQWMAGTARWGEANRDAIAGMTEEQVSLAVAKGSGMLGILEARGLTEPAAAACLADPAERQRLIAESTEAWAVRGIPGTPYTLVNDRPVEGIDWPTLAAAIQAARERLVLAPPRPPFTLLSSAHPKKDPS